MVMPPPLPSAARGVKLRNEVQQKEEVIHQPPPKAAVVAQSAPPPEAVPTCAHETFERIREQARNNPLAVQVRQNAARHQKFGVAPKPPGSGGPPVSGERFVARLRDLEEKPFYLPRETIVRIAKGESFSEIQQARVEGRGPGQFDLGDDSAEAMRSVLLEFGIEDWTA